MTDLAAAGTAAGTGFAHRVGGEVILMHITLGFLVVKTVENLSVSDLTEGDGGQNLSLTSGEKAGTVNAGKQTDFGGERTHFVDSAAVDTLAVVKKPAANHKFLQFVEAIVKLFDFLGIFLVEFFVNLGINGEQSLVADALVVGVEGKANLVDCNGFHIFIHFVRRIV